MENVNIIEVNGKVVVFVDVYPRTDYDAECLKEISCAIFDNNCTRLDQ